ncbi:MAG TPA: PqqD family peptide modification chaperone [Polyangiaceae bacterium]
MDKSRLEMLAISDTGFVFDPRTGHSYTVNATGLTVLNELKRGASAAAALQRLQETFDCPPSALADLRAFTDALNNFGFFETTNVSQEST